MAFFKKDDCSRIMELLQKKKRKSQDDGTDYPGGGKRPMSNLLTTARKMNNPPSISSKKTYHQMQNPKLEDRSQMLTDRCKGRLNSSKFRSINEYLYTHTSGEVNDYMDEQAFSVYHEAYQSIVCKWPIKPIDVIKEKLTERYEDSEDFCLADMGCGRVPMLKECFPNHAQVHSFDLVSEDPDVTRANIAKVPLGPRSCDCVVFALSMMGTNISDYLREANRIMKMGGRLIIAEVASRFEDVSPAQFGKHLKCFGFHSVETSYLPPNQFFVLFEATKSVDRKQLNWKSLPKFSLKPCQYKPR